MIEDPQLVTLEVQPNTFKPVYLYLFLITPVGSPPLVVANGIEVESGEQPAAKIFNNAISDFDGKVCWVKHGQVVYQIVLDENTTISKRAGPKKK